MEMNPFTGEHAIFKYYLYFLSPESGELRSRVLSAEVSDEIKPITDLTSGETNPSVIDMVTEYLGVKFNVFETLLMEGTIMFTPHDWVREYDPKTSKFIESYDMVKGKDFMIGKHQFLKSKYLDHLEDVIDYIDGDFDKYVDLKEKLSSGWLIEDVIFSDPFFNEAEAEYERVSAIVKLGVYAKGDPCRVCGSTNTVFSTAQTRSGDEGQTSKTECKDCGTISR
jgi:hypothetical protein